jgi:RND family efflux transporter MFP subunit
MSSLRWFLAALAAAGCASPSAPPADPPLPQVTVHVEPIRLTPRVIGEEVVGTVRARDRAELTELRCAIGSAVKRGDLIARLSVQELTARLDQAREATAQAALELARATRLRDTGALPGADYDAAASRHRIAQASQAEAAAMASYLELRAPLAGVVIAKGANLGDTAMPGRPVCVVEDPSALRFEALVPERLAGAFGRAAAISVALEAAGAPLVGQVVEVSPNADAASRTVLVKLALPADPRLRAGGFGRATLPAGEVSALTAPARAVVRRGQLEAVFVVDGATARMRLVRTGAELGDRIELRSGVRDGERVVVDGADALVDGQPVAVAR